MLNFINASTNSFTFLRLSIMPKYRIVTCLEMDLEDGSFSFFLIDMGRVIIFDDGKLLYLKSSFARKLSCIIVPCAILWKVTSNFRASAKSRLSNHPGLVW